LVQVYLCEWHQHARIWCRYICVSGISMLGLAADSSLYQSSVSYHSSPTHPIAITTVGHNSHISSLSSDIAAISLPFPIPPDKKHSSHQSAIFAFFLSIEPLFFFFGSP